MTQLLAHAHRELILNGFRINDGWADNDPPIDFEFEDAIEEKTGQDGGSYGLSKPSLGCIMTIFLQPNAPGTQWCINQEQMRKNSLRQRTALRIYAGIYTDPAQNVTYRVEGGVIKMFPAVQIPNKTYEAKMKFELIESLVDGGVFHPLGVS